MSAEYHIEGNIAVEIKDEKVTFLLTPLQEYLSPDNKYAVFFSEENTELDMKSYKLEEQFLKLEVKDDNNKYISHLITIALDQKRVRLHIEYNYCSNIKLIGFTYPIEKF